MGAKKFIKPMFPTGRAWKILKGDLVQVIAGKDKGEQGTVTEVIRDKKFPRVIIEGLNLHKRHIKKTKEGPGRVIPVEAPIHYSNVAVVDPQTGKPCRIEFRFLEDGKKVRVTRGKLASNSIVPRAREKRVTQTKRPAVTPGPKDTPLELALQQTYTPPPPPEEAAAAAASPAAAAARPSVDGKRAYSTLAGTLSTQVSCLVFGRQPLMSWRSLLRGGMQMRGFAAGSAAATPSWLLSRNTTQ